MLGQPGQCQIELLRRRVGDDVGVGRTFVAFVYRRIDVGQLALEGSDQGLAHGTVVRADDEINLLVKHQADARLGRVGGGDAAIDDNQFNLLVVDAAGCVDLIDGQLGAGLLGRAEQRGRAGEAKRPILKLSAALAGRIIAGAEASARAPAVEVKNCRRVGLISVEVNFFMGCPPVGRI